MHQWICVKWFGCICCLNFLNMNQWFQTPSSIFWAGSDITIFDLIKFIQIHNFWWEYLYGFDFGHNNIWQITTTDHTSFHTLLRGKGTKLKLSMVWALSQNCQHFFWKTIWLSWSKLSEKLKNGITILVGPADIDAKYCFDQKLKNHLA